MKEEILEKETKVKKLQAITFKVNKKGLHVNGWLTFLRVCIAPLVRLFYPCRYYGNKNIPNGPVLYVMNHYRMVDPLYPLLTTKEGIHFIAKKETFSMPIFGFFCKKTKAIAVNRDGADIRGLMDALKCLKHGDKVSICPEGTRNKTQEAFLPFKSGAAMLAIKAKVPIIPVVIYKKARFLRMTHILVGDPIQFSEYYGQKLTDEVLKAADEKVVNRFWELRNQHEQYLAKKKGK
jgi:1-acyl-sn-glycerol-3-phosphate acyltransferase